MKIQIAFLMDCTGSMEQWIQAAKKHIQTIVETTQTQHGNDIHMRVGFIGYRDYGDPERFVVEDFADATTILQRIRDVHAEGGDDIAEDVAGGLFHVKQLSWDDADIKLLFHIADAPPHGIQFHARFLSDRFPGGDPDGRNPLDTMSFLSDQGIAYTFVKINPTTDTMIEQFSNCYSDKFKVLDLQGQGHRAEMLLGPSITQTITDSICYHHTCSQDPVAVEHTPI